MAEIRIPLVNHGRPGSGVGLRVEPIDGIVYVDFEPEDESEGHITRSLTADEARAFAAVLLHVASEVNV